MPVSGERTIIGPKTLVIPCPNIEAFFNTFFAKKLLTVNTGPKAGQTWEVMNAFFRFPAAKRNNVFVLPGVKAEFTFNVSMSAGGVLIAEQEFLEKQNTNEPKEETEIPMHIVGSLEPFAPATVYPGQGLNFEYSVSKNAAGSLFIQSGQGEIVVTYNLIQHRRSNGRSR